MDPQFAADWMKDLDTFTAAIEKETSYAATLSRSMSLVRPDTRSRNPEL